MPITANEDLSIVICASCLCASAIVTKPFITAGLTATFNLPFTLAALLLPQISQSEGLSSQHPVKDAVKLLLKVSKLLHSRHLSS